MEYTKEQIEGNIMQLILDKVNSEMKPLETNLQYLIQTPEKYATLIQLTIECMQKSREELFAMYGVKPMRLGEIKNM